MVQQESRVKKTLLNARVNLIFYFLTLALSFFSRKIFLDCLGANFVGLTGTLQNLLGFLNLAELGIGSAIGYLLYKPLFEHDQQKINEIISVMGYLYRWIGIIILAAGIILSFFLPLIFPDSDTGFSLPLIYFAYFSFLGSSLIGYFINYRQNLLGADQRNYVVTAYFQSATIIKTLVQMVLAYYTANYYLWVVVEFAFGIIYSFILNWKINQTYPWLKAEVAQGKKLFRKYPEVMTKTRQLFVHQINTFVQFQTTPIITYAFTSLNIVACLGNYTLIIDKICTLMNTVLGGVSAGVGNLIAEGNKNKILNIFWQITVLRTFISGIFFYCCFFSFDSFLTLWVGKEYLLPTSVLILLLSKIYIQISIGGIGQFVYGYGLFGDIWASITQSALFFIIALIGGYYFQLNGILFSALFSIAVIMGIWKPYYLFSRGFKIKPFIYWKKWAFFNVLNILSFISAYGINSVIKIEPCNNVFSWFVCTFILSLVYVVVSMVIFLSLSHSFKSLVYRLLKLNHEV